MTFFIEKDEAVPAEYWVRRRIEIVEVRENGDQLTVFFNSNFIGCDPFKRNRVTMERYYISPLGREVSWKECGMSLLEELLPRQVAVFKTGTLEREAFLRELEKLTTYPRFTGDLELSVVSDTFCIKEVTR